MVITKFYQLVGREGRFYRSISNFFFGTLDHQVQEERFHGFPQLADGFVDNIINGPGREGFLFRDGAIAEVLEEFELYDL